MHRWHLYLVVLLAFSLLALDSSVAHADEWEDMGVQDGVRVSRMQVEGSSVMAFRGEIVTETHIANIAQVFLDPTLRGTWVDRYHSHGTMERTDRHELYWIRFALPVGISDRDYLLRADLEVDESRKDFIARVNSVEDGRHGEQRCCVRAETETFYHFRALPNGRTRMIVEVHTDPKGLIPNWLVNRIQRDWPSKTLTNLIARARQSDVRPHPDYANWH